MTRIALAPFAAVAALAAWPALAQDAPVPTAPSTYASPAPAAPVAAPAPAPAAPQTPPLTAEDMWPDAPPPPPPPPPIPLMPTGGDALQLFNVLNNACVPLIGGGDVKSVAPGLGLKKKGPTDWILQLDATKKITLTPPDAVNPTVCTVTILYDLGGQAAVEGWVDAWAQNHLPRMNPVKVREAGQGFDYNLVISTWLGDDAQKFYVLALNQQKKSDGSPVTRNADQARILFTITPK